MPARPNIVFVLSDQQHRDTVGAYGAARSPTPHLDRLADEGTRYDNAWCCSAICSPSRAALFTGRLPHRFGSVRNDLTIPAGTPNLAAALAAQGYRLGYSGKWHVDKATLPTDYGFEGKNFPGYGFPAWLFTGPVDPSSRRVRENAYYEYLADRGFAVPTLSDTMPTWEPERKALLLAARQSGPQEAAIPWFVGEEGVRLAESFCRRRKSDGRPFFLWMNFWGPHNPCHIPEPWFSMFDPAEIPEPASLRETFAGKPACQKLMAHYWGTWGAPWDFWRRYLAAYLGYCALIDAQIGRLRVALERAGEWENTLFIYSADHGDMMGRHQLTDKGPYMYDDIYRIPLIARGPGMARGGNDDIVYLHDLYDTALAASGAPPDPKSDGRSLAGAGGPPREAVFGEFDCQILTHPQRMIRTPARKFVWNAGDISELYDLERDPDEMTNRAQDPAYAGDKRILAERLLEHLRRTSDPLARILEAVRHGL